MADITDTTVTISENDPPMPKLHLKPKLMPMPPYTTTAITDTVTDTDITDIPMELMADTTDITDILMLMLTVMPTISANVKPKPMLPQQLMLMPMPLSSMASTIPELPDTPEQPLHTLTDPSKELHTSHTEDIMADITDSVDYTDTLILDKKLYL